MKDNSLTKKEIIQVIKEMIKSYDNLPPEAMVLPVNQYDFCSLLLLLQALFEEKSEEKSSD